MKAFAPFAAVLGLAVGLTAAGPVDLNGTDSMCNIQCHGARNGAKVAFVPGRMYSYKYSTKTETALEQTTNEKSTIYMDADVTLHAIDSCRLALKIESARLEEEISGRGRQPSRGAQQLSEILMKNPLVFNFEDGAVSRLCPAVHESNAALNIKRGILSLIQNSMGGTDRDETIDELDVTGECRTHYTITKGWGGDLTVLKKKSLSGCRNEDSQSFNSISFPRHIARSSSVVNASQECQQTIKNSIVNSVECRERHVVRPFRRQEKGAATLVSQALHLQGVSEGVQADHFRYQENKHPMTLLFDRRADMEAIGVNLEQRALSLVERLVNYQKTDTQEVPAMFSELVKTLRQMDYASLKKLVTARREATMVDALMQTMTHDAIKLTSELVVEGTVSDSAAKIWLMRTALATDVNPKIIMYLMRLFEKQSLMMESHLAASAVGKTAYLEGRGRSYNEIRSLLGALRSELANKKNEDEVVAVLKAVGNLGEIAASLNEDVIRIAKNKRYNTLTRIAAIEATRHFACGDAKAHDMIEMFTDYSDEVEVRIAGYLGAIKCPSDEMIETVKNTLLKEGKESQVASFVYTHMKNLDKRSWFHHDVSGIVNNEQLKKFELSSMSFSKSRVYEMFFDPMDMGFEVEADSIMSNNFKAFMLNATFDMFGHNVNVFDGRVRMQNDMSAFDGFVRFFGKEVMYKNFNKRKSAELERILKTVMSPEGLHFTRSMMILDTEMVLPTGTGLPLTIAMNATSSLSMSLKANPLQGQQENKFAAEAHASPAAALEFGILMTVKAPQTVSGIRMMAIASSQWTLDGKMKMDLRAPSEMRLEIGAPRDRSDLIDIKSNIYLVGANRQLELASNDARKQQWNYCTGETGHVLFGHKLCLGAEFPVASRSEAPFFLLRGKTHMNLRMLKTDKSLSKFEFEASTTHVPGAKDQVLLKLDTPGSQVDRQILGRVYNDLQNKKFGVELISPLKKAVLEGTYQNSAAAKTMQILAKVDNETKMTINADLGIAKGRQNIYTPVLEVLMGNGKQVLLIKSEVALFGNHKVSGDFEIITPYNKDRPLKLNGEYAIAGRNKKRVALGIQCELLDANVMSTLSYGEGPWAASAEGHYSYNKGPKRLFVMDGKLEDREDNLVVEANLHHDGAAIMTANGRYTRQNPHTVDAVVTLYGKRYGAKLSHDKQAKENVLTAVAEIGSKRYGSSLRYALNSQKSKLNLKVELPDGTEKTVKMSYARVGDSVKISGMSNIYSEPYSVVLSYIPQNGQYKVTGDLRMGEETFQANGVLNVEESYQCKVELLHNNAKVLLASLGVGKDIRRPTLKISVIYREKLLLDASTEAVFERHGASVLFAMRAPKKVNGNAALKMTGSMRDNLKVETNMDVKSQDNLFDFAMTSSADLSIYGRSKRANVEGSLKIPRGNFKLTLKNMADDNSWNVEWLLRTPEDERDSKFLTSGAYNLDPKTKMHLKGQLEMDAKLLGRRLRIEPVSLNTELRFGREDMEFKTDVSRSSKTIMTVTLKGGNGEQKSEVLAEVALMDKIYSAEATFFGRDLRTGVKMTLGGRWNDKKIQANGDLQLSPESAILKGEIETPFEMLPQAKVLLQQQTVSQGTKAILVELVHGDRFIKADLSVSRRHLEANVRSSRKDWENMRLTGAWQDKPRMRLTLGFHHPKYQDNSMEIEFDKVNERHSIKGRLSIPAMFRGELAELEGSLEKGQDLLSGKARINVSYRGEPKMKVFVESRNEANFKRISVAVNHSLRADDKQLLKAEIELKKTGKHSYEGKLMMQKNSEQIFDGQFSGTLKTAEGFLAELQLDAKTSLLRQWNSLWMMNKIVAGSDKLHISHQFGRSPRDILSNVEVSGTFKNIEGQLVMDGTISGQWKDLKGSVSAELKSDKSSMIQMEAKVDSQNGHLMLAKLDLTRREQMIVADGKLELPQMKQEMSIKMSTGLPQKNAFEFNVKLDRNNVPSKSASISIRVPFGGETVDGHFKIDLPEELGDHAGQVTLMMKPRMVDASAEAKIYKDSYAAQGSIKVDRGVTVSGTVSSNKKTLGKLEISAERKGQDLYAVSTDLAVFDKTYKGKLEGELSSRRALFSADADSNTWSKRHFVKAAYSRDTNTAELKVDIAQLKLNIDSTMSDNYRLKANADYEDQRLGELELSCVPAKGQGNFRGVWGDKTVAGRVEKRSTGELRFEMPSTRGELSWNELQNGMKLDGKWDSPRGDYAQTVELTWGDKLALKGHLRTPSGQKNLEAELQPRKDGKADLVYSVDQRKVFGVGAEWASRQRTMDIKGHWIFQDGEWRVELTMNPQKVGEVKAKVYYKNQQVGFVESEWDMENKIMMKFNFELTHHGEKHDGQLGFDWQKGSLVANAFLQCPWMPALKGSPLEFHTTVRYSPQHFSVQGQLKERGLLHSIKTEGKIAGEQITGSVEVICPTYGSFKGTLQGMIKNTEVSFKIESDKLRRPIEFSGKMAQQGGELTYTLVSENVQMNGEIFYSNTKVGVTVHSKEYEIVAIGRAHQGLIITVQTPGLKKTGMMVQRRGNGQYGIEVEYDGKKVVEAEWTYTHPSWLAGHVQMKADFGARFGQHEIKGEYDLVDRHSAKLIVDGNTVFDLTLSRDTKSIRISFSTEQMPDTEIYFKHGDRDAMFSQAFRIKQAGKKFGYEMLLNRVHAVMIVELPERSVRMAFRKQRGQNGNEIDGEIAWDNGRDANKKMQVRLARAQQGDNQMVLEASIALPVIGKKMDCRMHMQKIDSNTWKVNTEAKYNGQPMLSADGRITQTRQGYQASFSGKHPVTGKSWTGSMSWRMMSDMIRDAEAMLNYGGDEYRMRLLNNEQIFKISFDQGYAQKDFVSIEKESRKLSMSIQGLQAVAQLSRRESRLIAVYDMMEYINIGYAKHGKTMSIFARWKPQLGADLQMAAKNVQRKLQRGGFEDRMLASMEVSDYARSEYKQLSNYLYGEARAFMKDLRAMADRAVELYQREPYLKAALGPMVRCIRNTAQWINRVADEASENLADMSKRFRRSAARYGERLNVVKTVVEAISNEIYEDVADQAEDWMQRINFTPEKSAVRRVVQRSIDLVKRGVAEYGETVERLAEDHICEFSSEKTHLKNKRCGFAYKLQPNMGDLGFAMSVPVGLSY